MFVEFHSHYFFIKDKVMKKILLQGSIHKDLYKIFFGVDANEKHTLEENHIVATLATNFIWHE